VLHTLKLAHTKFFGCALREDRVDHPVEVVACEQESHELARRLLELLGEQLAHGSLCTALGIPVFDERILTVGLAKAPRQDDDSLGKEETESGAGEGERKRFAGRSSSSFSSSRGRFSGTMGKSLLSRKKLIFSMWTDAIGRGGRRKVNADLFKSLLISRNPRVCELLFILFSFFAKGNDHPSRILLKEPSQGR
jgi:hypothetical protein